MSNAIINLNLQLKMINYFDAYTKLLQYAPYTFSADKKINIFKGQIKEIETH